MPSSLENASGKEESPVSKECNLQPNPEPGEPPPESGPLPREPSIFPNFKAFPTKIRLIIWELAMRHGARFIMQSWPTNGTHIFQGLPVVAHVCQEARAFALEQGRMYRLEDGKQTWFQKKTDWLLWCGAREHKFGDLALDIKNIVIPKLLVDDLQVCNETIEQLVHKEGFVNLKNIYIELGSKFTLLNKHWNPSVGPALFGDVDTIVLPNVIAGEAEWDRVDRVTPILPYGATWYWNEHNEFAFCRPGDPEMKPWTDVLENAADAWRSATARLNPEIGEAKLEAYKSGELVHPSGKMSWVDHDIANGPKFVATCVFTRLTDRERIEGKLTREDYISSEELF